MLFIWVQYDKTGEYEPHMTFEKFDKDAADFEIRDLRDHGHRATYGKPFDLNRDSNGNWIGTVQNENGWTP